MKMQPGYEWLWNEPGPVELLKALKLYGTTEVPGKGNNPTIMAWAKEVHTTYPGDAEAWCGLGRSVVAKRAGWDFHPNGNALWARNWASWGVAREGPALLFDTLVFPRGQGGHVAFYVAEDATHYHIFGFNQGDTVKIVRKAKTPILAIRHAPWRIAQPANVRRVFVPETGGAPLSTKEA